MATKKITPVMVEMQANAHKIFGLGLWETVASLCEGQVSNTVKDALPEDADPRKLVGPAMYWQNGKYGLQVVVKLEGDGWFYAGVTRDKDGDLVMSDTNEYEIRDVVAKSEYKVVDRDGKPVLDDKGGQVVIKKGFLSTKAYAL